ncbi:NH(3)-dependent NAD(+) synthetase NadE [Gottschalkia purinilytica]|uniref:NH(3)-dependent NAD(+) synthetase n=1 Tax=Gottschalkia purinilytica TaxID=1503 RepID=A0A0L0WCW0_GOTPU|nr:NAD(+) synthase [Gottschalkia purinilytica]KNF09245.1 NH(3)-dependent NAD(+) synthetase NadE [Gottschalkia purinilytica]
MNNIEKTCNDIVNWIKEKVNEAGCKGLVFGLSGGIDSAVIAGLSKKAFPKDSLGVIMPCHSNPEDEEHARLVAKSLDINIIKVDLTNTFDVYTSELGFIENNRLATSNIKPRLRMTTLYYYAQLNNYLVVGSSNKSEITIGYFTKHGDSGVDILPIADLVKEEVKELAKYLQIDEAIISKPPSAGLWENQTDEDEMGFGYEELDSYIKGKNVDDISKETRYKIEKMNKISEHKRKFPPIFIQS